jgi:hypothetical protein
VSSFDKVSMEFGSGHRRHVDVSDQTGRFGEMRGREEIGWRHIGDDAPVDTTELITTYVRQIEVRRTEFTILPPKAHHEPKPF